MDKISEQNALPKSADELDLYGPFQTLDIAHIALESTDIGFWIIDLTTKTFLPSPAAKELFGYTIGDEMPLDAAMSRIAKKHKPEVVATIENAFTKREKFSVVFPISYVGNNERRWLNILGGCNNTEDNNCYFSGIVIDVTEQKHNDLRKNRFIGMVSHELKTPLTALKGYIQMLNTWAKKQKDQFTIGALSKADRQVKKMLNMINGLLNLSGVESGKIHLNKRDFLMDQLIREVVEETQFITALDNIILANCEPVKVNADWEKIEQVLINLLSNAAKYSKKGSPIEISCIQSKDGVQVSVKDSGMGIKPEDVALLFEPHYRVERKETEKIPGFGIGLYLCSEIIKRHDGKIWVESEIDKGSTFSFWLSLTQTTTLHTSN